MVSSQSYQSYPLGSEMFYLPSQYQPIKSLGFGGYGSVITAEHKPSSNIVAIKKMKIRNVDEIKRILREVIILKSIKHENVIPLFDVILNLNEAKVKKLSSDDNDLIGEIYLVMEKMGSDLQKIIESKQELSDIHYKFILFQILRALAFLHSANIVHRDFKPSNVLINEDTTIKICDFGMSRNLEKDNLQLSEYVTTRYYRAPEVMLCSHHYNMKIDVWSVGCTFAELLSKQFLFPGENYLEQIQLIISILGSQSEEDLKFISNNHAKQFVQNLQNVPKKSLALVIKNANPLAIDLLEKMLVFNPEKRISIEDAINHPYLKEIREEEVDVPLFIGQLNFDFEYNKTITSDEILQLLIKEIQSFDSMLKPHPPSSI